MAFKNVLGHSKPIGLLQRAIRNDRMAHSYLFLGNEGIGKKLVALQFAKALNCLHEGRESGDACDQCLSCKKIENLIHPDVLVLEPENQTLKVEQVRQMQRDLAFRPYEGKYRICILSSADRMAPHMSNTLLKTLEEPPPYTILILLANHVRLILPTILSRCQLIRFNPLPISMVSQCLREKQGLDEGEAHLLASLSEGSPGKALEIKDEIRKIPREKLLGDLIGIKSLTPEMMQGWIKSFPTDKREKLLLVLEVAKTLLRDMVLVKALKEGSKMIHSDLLYQIKTLTSNWQISSLLKRMETLHQTTFAIRNNANTELALAAMMLSWTEG